MMPTYHPGGQSSNDAILVATLLVLQDIELLLYALLYQKNSPLIYSTDFLSSLGIRVLDTLHDKDIQQHG